jgi:hypothetical protein
MKQKQKKKLNTHDHGPGLGHCLSQDSFHMLDMQHACHHAVQPQVQTHRGAKMKEEVPGKEAGPVQDWAWCKTQSHNQGMAHSCR